jgi:hypothetical protein
MELLFVLFTFATFLYVAFLQIDAYNTLVVAKFRFRFFAIRDKLAMLVCDGSLSENSWEYKYLIDALNFHISVVETLSIVEIAERLVQFHTSPSEDKAFERLKKTVDKPVVKEVLVEYMTTVYSVLERNSKWQARVIKIAISIIAVVKWNPPSVAAQTIVNPAPALRVIDQHRVAFATAA